MEPPAPPPTAVNSPASEVAPPDAPAVDSPIAPPIALAPPIARPSTPPGGAAPPAPDVARPDDPDDDIVRMVVAGDTVGALNHLMQRHGRAVFRYCSEELRDSTLADDVQQRVFIEAFRDLPTFARRSSLRTWLFAIVRHRVLDTAKARRRERSHIDDDSAPDACDPTPPTGERLDDVKLSLALVACVAKLPEPVRTAVVLRYQHGFTFEEMAVICKEKPGTLQARVSRALPLLRACVEWKGGRL